MKHKNAHSWQEMADRISFYKLMIPKIQMQSVSNGLRRLRIKTWRQYDVSGTVHKQIWCFFKVPAPPSVLKQTIISAQDVLKRTGDVLDDRNEAPGTKTGKVPEANKTKSDYGSKRCPQENISTKTSWGMTCCLRLSSVF